MLCPCLVIVPPGKVPFPPPVVVGGTQEVCLCRLLHQQATHGSLLLWSTKKKAAAKAFQKNRHLHFCCESVLALSTQHSITLLAIRCFCHRQSAQGNCCMIRRRISRNQAKWDAHSFTTCHKPVGCWYPSFFFLGMIPNVLSTILVSKHTYTVRSIFLVDRILDLSQIQLGRIDVLDQSQREARQKPLAFWWTGVQGGERKQWHDLL